MQLPVVLALRPEVQRGSLRQVERVWLHWHAAPRYIQMPSDSLRDIDLLLDSFHLDTTAYTSPG